MKIENLDARHLKEVYDIRFSVNENMVHSHQIHYLHRKQILEDIAQNGGWICKIGEVYAGYGLGIYVPNPLIGGLFVRPEFQGKAIGSAILAMITDWFFTHGSSEIELTTDPESKAVKFYEKHGWKSAGKDEFGQLIMKKKNLNYA